MTSAYILIAAILLLGGLIAALGDRVGTKVGKARLRLFNLRPRQTAIVVTVLTGTIIAASTLGILFSLSESLRQGIFELDNILKKRKEVTKELATVTEEKNQVEKELEEAKTKQAQAQRRLNKINQNFQQAQAQLKTVSDQVNDLRSEVKTLLSERQQLLQQRNQLREQITQLQEQVQQRDRELAKQKEKIAAQDKILEERKIRLQQLEKQQSVLQAEISQRDEVIMQLDKAIATKDRNLQEREARLVDLESQLEFLKREVEVLDQYYQTYQELREKRIALVRGQVLAFGVVRIVDPKAVIPAIDQLLRQANRTAIEAIGSGKGAVDKRVVKITKAQVQQLIKQIQDGRDYVVRILSAGNYVQGEEEVRVFTDVALNQKIFNAGEVIATVSVDSANMTEEDIEKRLDLLLAASKFRARRSGILGKIQVGDDRLTTLIGFIKQLNEYEKPLDEIKAVASETTYTSGPLKLRLVAVRDGKKIFST
ncbi:MAG: DUF3084 domain-containing protein [Xenococcaceae cyanobacterium]